MIEFDIMTARFAPFCNAQLETVRHALQDTGRVVIVITDADLAQTSRLPWTADEREAMCRAALAEFGDRVRFVQIDERPRQFQDLAKMLISVDKEKHLKSHSNFGGASVGVLNADEEAEAIALNALYVGDDVTLKNTVPPATFDQVTALRQSPLFPGLAEEHRYLEDYKASWAVAPYPVVLNSVDMVLVHSGSLLLIERGRVPGKGLWALPGGFVEPDEWLLDAALRELHEETGLQLHPAKVDEHLKGSKVFDDPWRSGRGRVITHAFHFELDGLDKPFVYGQDDAAAARWVPLADLNAMRGRFFDDHSRIIAHFLKI